MDMFSALQRIGPMVDEMTPKVEEGMSDLKRVAVALESINERLDKVVSLMADYMNYVVTYNEPVYPADIFNVFDLVEKFDSDGAGGIQRD